MLPLNHYRPQFASCLSVIVQYPWFFRVPFISLLQRATYFFLSLRVLACRFLFYASMSLPIAPRPAQGAGDQPPLSPALVKARKISTACGACKQRKTRVCCQTSMAIKTSYADHRSALVASLVMHAPRATANVSTMLRRTNDARSRTKGMCRILQRLS
jgi:hypothetical protein